MNHDLTGPALRKWREDRNLSQEALGEMLGFSREWMGKLEREEKPISGDTYLKFERIRREPRFSLEENSESRMAFELNEGSPVDDAAAALRVKISMKFGEVMLAAGDDAGKLGWIRTQIGEHLKIPSSWNEARDVHEQIEKHPLKDVPLFPPHELASPEEHARLYGPPKSSKPKAQASK